MYTLYSIHYKVLYTTHLCIQYALYGIQYALYAIQCIVYTIYARHYYKLYIAYFVYCSLYNVWYCTIYNVHCTLYTIHNILYRWHDKIWAFISMTFKKIQLVVDNPSAVYYSGKCARTVMCRELDTAVHVQIKRNVRGVLCLKHIVRDRSYRICYNSLILQWAML